MMAGLEQQLLALVGKHGPKGVLVDTNVLLLYLFGQFMPSALGQKRLSKYTPDDASLITQFLARFSTILTTQHVLAETSNLARQIVSGRQQLELFSGLYPLFCLNMPESLAPCDVRGAAIDANVFARLGLTDDLDLYVAAVSTGGDAVNFTHMREAAGIV